MHRPQQRLVSLGLIVAALLVVSALIYQAGMARLEARPRSFWMSLEWAAETLSTTGYGADSQWSHPAMVIFVVLVQFAGVFLVFLIVPIVLVPFLEERFEERLPREADQHLRDHVVVYRYGPTVETLLLRLRENKLATLVVETDEAQARIVRDLGMDVVFIRSEEDALDVCRLDSARAVVANGRDEENAALVLRARQKNFDGEVYAFVQEPAHRKPMELAGATAAYTPRHIVAAALAAHASDNISPRLPGLDMVRGVVRREVRVPAASPLVGRRLGDAKLGVVVAGQWSRSRLDGRCPPETIIEPRAVLELVGTEEAIRRAVQKLGGTLLRDDGPFLVAGFGEVGRKVREILTDVGETVHVLERLPMPDVDTVGNVLDISVLIQAGLREARALVLALDSDDSTLFATVIVRDAAPDVPLIARVNHARNVDNIHRAGADYALSISDISGEMLSSRLLGRKVRARDERRRVRAIPAGVHAGTPIREVPLRVFAMERAGALLYGIDEGRVEADDRLWVIETD